MSFPSATAPSLHRSHTAVLSRCATSMEPRQSGAPQKHSLRNATGAGAAGAAGAADAADAAGAAGAAGARGTTMRSH